MAKTNYNKMANKAKAAEKAVVETSSLEIEQSTNEIVEPVVEESMATKPEIKTGVVVNCEKLNVRTNPHPSAHVELVINKGTEVEIDGFEVDFYHVRKNGANGFSGWCMKKFISVK